MPGFADLDFCLSQLNDSGTYGFQEHWFFTFGLSLDLGCIPFVIGIGFSGSCFWFFSGLLDLVFCLDIVVLVNRSI